MLYGFNLAVVNSPSQVGVTMTGAKGIQFVMLKGLIGLILMNKIIPNDTLQSTH